MSHVGHQVIAPCRIDFGGPWTDSPPYIHEYGGATFNVAINFRVVGRFEGDSFSKFAIFPERPMPPGAGLGSSGALRAVIHVLSEPSLLPGSDEEREHLVNSVFLFENGCLNQRGGKQDQSAAIYGSGNLFIFHKEGGIDFIPIDREELDHLENRLVLVFAGEADDDRQSSTIHHRVFDSEHYPDNIARLDRMRELAYAMVRNITNEPIMADLLCEQWWLQRLLHPLIENNTMRRLQNHCAELYLAAKATGAGRGCMVFYVSPDNRTALVNKIKQFPGVQLLDFQFEHQGIHFEQS